MSNLILKAIRSWKKGSITTNLLLKVCKDSNFKVSFYPNGDVETERVDTDEN